MAESRIGPQSFTFGVKAPVSQARPQSSSNPTGGGVSGGGAQMTANAPGGEFAKQDAINRDEMNSIIKLMETRMKPRMDRLQQEQATYGAMNYGSKEKLKEVVDKQPWFSRIFGDTHVVTGARQFTVVSEHQNMLNEVTRDMEELKKLPPEEMQAQMMERIRSLETGDPIADATLRTQAMGSLPDISKLYTAKNIEWTQSEMKRAQFNAIKAAGDRLTPLAKNLTGGTIDPEEFQAIADREIGGLIAPVDGQTEESYRDNLSAVAQYFVQTGNYHGVNALTRSGVLDGLSPDEQNRARAVIENGKPQAVAQWARENQEELAEMNIAVQRATASGDMEGARQVIRAVNGRIMLETGVDYSTYDEAKSVTEMQLSLDTNRAKLQRTQIEEGFAIEAGLIDAEARTLVGRTDEESLAKLEDLKNRSVELNERLRAATGDPTAEIIDMRSLISTAAVTTHNLGLQRDKDYLAAERERKKLEREQAQDDMVLAATATSILAGNGSKVPGLQGQTEEIRDRAFSQVYDALPTVEQKIQLLSTNFATVDEVNTTVQNQLQAPLKMASEGGRWNDALVPTIDMYQQMISRPGGGAAARAYFGKDYSEKMNLFLNHRTLVADPAIAWEMAFNAPPPIPDMNKQNLQRIESAVDKHINPGLWSRMTGSSVSLSPAGNRIVRDHLVRNVAAIQAGNPNIGTDQAIGMAMGSFAETGGEYAGKYAWYRDPKQSPNIREHIGKPMNEGEAELAFNRNDFGQTIESLVRSSAAEAGMKHDDNQVTIIPGDDFGMDTLYTIVVGGERDGMPVTRYIQKTLGELNQLYRDKLIERKDKSTTVLTVPTDPYSRGRNTL